MTMMMEVGETKNGGMPNFREENSNMAFVIEIGTFHINY